MFNLSSRIISILGLVSLAATYSIAQELPPTVLQKAAKVEAQGLLSSELVRSLTPEEKEQFVSALVSEFKRDTKLTESERNVYVNDITVFMDAKRASEWARLKPLAEAKVKSLKDFSPLGEFTWIKLDKVGDPITDPMQPVKHKVFVIDALTNDLIINQNTVISKLLSEMPPLIQELAPLAGLGGHLKAYVIASKPERIGAPVLYYIELNTEN